MTSAPVGPVDVVAGAFAGAGASVDRVMATLAALEQADFGDLVWTRDEATALVDLAAVLSHRVARVRSRVLAVVGRAREEGRLHHLDDAQLAAGAGRMDAADARRDRDLAAVLGNGVPGPEGPRGQGRGEPPTAPRFPRLAAACDAGQVGERQAMVVVSTLEGLPEHLTEHQRQRAEEVLVEWAGRLGPSALRRRARRVLAEVGVDEPEVDAHENEQVRSEEQAAWENASLWMRDNGDGTWDGHFRLPDLQAHMLRKVLDALTAPRRRTPPGQGAVDGAAAERPSATGDARYDRAWWNQQRGRAFAELLDHLPADGLGGKVNAVLLVRTDLETLRGESDRAGVTDTGAVLSAGQVRRLASGAGIVPVVLGGASVPVDLGHQRRLFTESQRTALAAVYSHCAAQDCDRPFSWCEIHHADPWRPVRGPDGREVHPGRGRTDLGNAIPLCGQHHRQLDDPRLSHVITRTTAGRATVEFTWRRSGEPWSRRVAPGVS